LPLIFSTFSINQCYILLNTNHLWYIKEQDMLYAIISGTGLYEIPGIELKEQVVDTPYGEALVHVGSNSSDQLVFLTRHGTGHHTPPHKINYQANIKGLQMLGVKKILSTFAVGSINLKMPPRSLILIDDFIDFTSGRKMTFFDGGSKGLAHTEMSSPYCPALRQQLLENAPRFGLEMHTRGTYVCTNGPRLETPAEIRMYSMMGGDVVGMTGVPEVTLAREMGMHYAAVARSVNWAAGVEQTIEFVEEGWEETHESLISLFMNVLEKPLNLECPCQNSIIMSRPPENRD
jgi:5'-methylthioadenosine phosphorylase